MARTKNLSRPSKGRSTRLPRARVVPVPHIGSKKKKSPVKHRKYDFNMLEAAMLELSDTTAGHKKKSELFQNSLEIVFLGWTGEKVEYEPRDTVQQGCVSQLHFCTERIMQNASPSFHNSHLFVWYNQSVWFIYVCFRHPLDGQKMGNTADYTHGSTEESRSC